MADKDKTRKFWWAIAILIVVALILGSFTVYYSEAAKEAENKVERYKEKQDSLGILLEEAIQRFQKRSELNDSLEKVILRKDSMLGVIDIEIETINERYEDLVDDLHHYDDDEFGRLFRDL